jgi:hypothetical protein
VEAVDYGDCDILLVCRFRREEKARRNGPYGTYQHNSN